MKREFWALVFSVTVTVGLSSYPHNGFWSSPTLAQSALEEFSLEPMDIDRLDAILQEQVKDITGKGGQWRFSINEIPVIILADPNADRMRIFSPVIDAGEVTSEQMQKMMLANFHTALDARYAISDGLVVTTFIHPLSSLQEKDLLSAVNQVSSLAATFGTNYSSGELIFVPRGNGENIPDLEQPSPDDVQATKLPPNSIAATQYANPTLA